MQSVVDQNIMWNVTVEWHLFMICMYLIFSSSEGSRRHGSKKEGNGVLSGLGFLPGGWSKGQRDKVVYVIGKRMIKKLDQVPTTKSNLKQGKFGGTDTEESRISGLES